MAEVEARKGERWPIEQVRRPQTLPAGMFALRLTYDWREPEPVVVLTGAPLSPLPAFLGAYGTITLGAAVGITDRLEVGLTAPKLLCIEADSPSGCGPGYSGRPAGVTVAYGVVRRPEGQVMLVAGSYIDRAPRIFRGWAMARAKVVRWDRFAFGLEASFARDLSSHPYQPPSESLVGVGTDVAAQVTRRLVAAAGVGLQGPPGALTDPDLSIWGGLSFSFDRHVALSASAARTDLLRRRTWETRIGGTLYLASLVWWFGRGEAFGR